MESDNIAFDSDEHFHLALKAMEDGLTDTAILHLKRLLNMDPEHGRAHYLLGALYAEIRLFSRAIDEMKSAVELEPDLTTARFQLGLLYATSGMVNDAEDTWTALDELGENNPLFVFKRGLMHLLHDEFESCSEDLTKGIQLNRVNPALNNDMLRIVQTIGQLVGTNNLSDSAAQDSQPTDSDGRHILLSAYQTSEYDKDTEH